MASASEKIEKSKSEFQKDVKEIKETLKNEKWNTKTRIRYLIGKHKNALILIGVIAVFAFFTFFGESGEFEIPEWVYLLGLSSIVAGIVVYPIAKKIANYFVQDNRKALLEIGEKGFEVWNIPQDRIGTIQMTDGDINETKTIRDNEPAFELRGFEKIEEKGKEQLIGIGTWEGTASNLDVKRTWGNVVAMRDNLVPQAKKAREYDIKMPYWINKIENHAINDIVHQFEKGVTYKGEDVHKEIKEQMGIDDTLEKEKKESKDTIEDMNEKLEELSVAVNGSDK